MNKRTKPTVEPTNLPDDKQDAVLDAAATCFMARGYESTTIDHIAAALGATKGRVYHHFEAKADIFFAVYNRALDKCLAGVQPAISSDLPPHSKLPKMMLAHILTLMESLPYHSVANMGVEIYLREGALTPRQRRTMEAAIERRDDYERSYRQVIRGGVRDGSFIVTDLDITTHTLLASINAVSVWYRPRSDQDTAARRHIAKAVVETLLKGIVNKTSVDEIFAEP